MKRSVLAALLAAVIATPALPQTAPAPSTAAVVEEPILVPEHAPAGSSQPTAGAVGVGVGVAVAIVVIGLVSFAAALSSLGS